MYKNLFLVGTGNLFNAIGGFIYLTAVSLTLNIKDFGIYSLIISFFLLISKITELGTTSSFVTQTIKNSKDYKKSLLFLKLLLSIIVIIPLILFLHYYNLFKIEIFLLILLGLSGYMLNDYLFAIFQANENHLMTSLVNFLPAFIKLVCGLIIIISQLTLSLNYTLFIYFASLLICIVLILKIPKTTTDIANTINGAKVIFNKGYMGGAAQTLILAIPAINNSIIAQTSSINNIGDFALAEKISSIFSVAALGIFTVLLPYNTKSIKETKTYNYKKTLYLSIFLIISAIIMSIIAKPTLDFVYKNKYPEALTLLYMLIVSACITSITSVLENYFYILDKTKEMLSINLFKIAVLISVGMYATLNYGIYGLACVNIIASISSLILTFVTLYKTKA